MQPRSNKVLDRSELGRLAKSVKLKSSAQNERRNNPLYATPIPEEVCVQLSYRCNLNCSHCFQRSHDKNLSPIDQKMKSVDLDTDIFAKILAETEPARSTLFLWGGEPLMHKDWNDVASLIARGNRYSVLVTNGILIEKHIESILRLSDNLAILVSIDGFERENDSIRGRGTFGKIMNSVSLLMDLKRKGEYKGEVSLNCVINEAMIGKLYRFMEYCEDLGVNTLYFCLPWHISTNTAAEMDDYVSREHGWLASELAGEKPSWHAFDFNVGNEKINQLKNDLDLLCARKWNIKIRVVPAVEGDDIADFVAGGAKPAQCKSECLAVSNRMEILADGRVTSCKHFPEFIMGDLKQQGLLEIWHGERFNRFRKILSNGLMPVCSKCGLLYLNGV